MTPTWNGERALKFALLALCEVNPLVTGGFPSQMASNAEIVSIFRNQASIQCQKRFSKVITYHGILWGFLFACSYLYRSQWIMAILRKLEKTITGEKYMNTIWAEVSQPLKTESCVALGVAIFVQNLRTGAFLEAIPHIRHISFLQDFICKLFRDYVFIHASKTRNSDAYIAKNSRHFIVWIEELFFWSVPYELLCIFLYKWQSHKLTITVTS